MYRKSLTLIAGLLAVAAFALTPADAQARGSRGGGGGGRGGSWSGGRGGGWNGGGRGWYGGRGWGWGGVGVGIGLGYPYYGGYGYSGYGPGYYSNYSYPSYGGDVYYDTYPNYADTASSYSVTPSYSGDMPSADYGYGAPAQNNEAMIRVIVPPDAKVWFDDHATQQSGSMRMFETPALDPGKTFHYNVKAKWMDQNGKEITRTKRVDVNANGRTTVDLTQVQNEKLNQAPSLNQDRNLNRDQDRNLNRDQDRNLNRDQDRNLNRDQDRNPNRDQDRSPNRNSPQNPMK